jgi:hypothetical protein
VLVVTCAAAMAAAADAAISALASPKSAAVTSPFALANRCFALRSTSTGRYVSLSKSGAYTTSRNAGVPLYVKPTGLGTYMLYDRGRGLMAQSGNALSRTTMPGPPARWRIRAAPQGAFTITSTADGRELEVTRSRSLSLAPARKAGRRGQFTLPSHRGCRHFPEAQVGASGAGKPSVNHDGTVFGWADLEFHLTASFRAGGEVISGEDFSPFGITVALSAARDKQEHGPDGTLDTTGNLLRFGTPTGRTNIHGWPTFAGWPTYDTLTNQQSYWVWLERAWRSGLRLVFANASEDAPLCTLEPKRSHSCNEEQSIELQGPEPQATAGLHRRAIRRSGTRVLPDRLQPRAGAQRDGGGKARGRDRGGVLRRARLQ